MCTEQRSTGIREDALNTTSLSFLTVSKDALRGVEGRLHA